MVGYCLLLIFVARLRPISKFYRVKLLFANATRQAVEECTLELNGLGFYFREAQNIVFDKYSKRIIFASSSHRPCKFLYK